MTEDALKFIKLKDAVRLAKAANKTAGKSKVEDVSIGGEDDEGQEPFEIGSVCSRGTGDNRRRVTIMAV
eukprot:4938167-Prymnesium_polylepis.1